MYTPCSMNSGSHLAAISPLLSAPARTAPYTSWPQTSGTTCGAQPSCSSSSRSSSTSSRKFSRGVFEGTRLQKSRVGSRRRQAGCKVVQCAASDTVSPRLWRHRWRYMRSESARTNLGLPKADWHRYHLQVTNSLAECSFLQLYLRAHEIN